MTEATFNFGYHPDFSYGPDMSSPFIPAKLTPANGSKGLNENEVMLNAATYNLVNATVDYDTGLSLDRELTAAQICLASFQDQLQTYIGAHPATQGKKVDFAALTDDLEGKMYNLYGFVLQDTDKRSRPRNFVEKLRVTPAKAIGKVALIGAIAATSYAAGSGVEIARTVIKATPPILILGKTVFSSAARVGANKIFGQKYDEFLRPVTQSTKKRVKSFQKEQGIKLPLEEKVQLTRQIEISDRVFELHNEMWAWVGRRSILPGMATRHEVAHEFSAITAKRIGKVLGITIKQPKEKQPHCIE